MKLFMISFIASMGLLIQTGFAQMPPQLESQGFDAFKRNVYPIIRKQCTQCHDDNSRGPNHSSANPWVSYQKVLSYSNFSNIPMSKFITKGMDDHGNAYGGHVTVTKKELILVFQKWWNEGENTSFLQDKKVLKAQNIPALSDDGTYQTMKWDLSEIDPKLSGVKYAVDIQRFSKADTGHGGAYRLKNPRFESAGKNIEVQSLNVVMNAIPDLLANTYASVKTVVGDGMPISPSLQIVLESKGEGKDQIAFAFSKVEVTAKKPIQQQIAAGVTTTAPGSKSKQLVLKSRLDAFDETKVGKAAKFAQILPGTVDMGSADSDPNHSGNEKLHKVRISKPFEIQTTDVTQLQWYLIMKGNQQNLSATPSRFSQKENCDEGNFLQVDGGSICKNHPVEKVSWDDIHVFISRLNQIQSDYTYRLPSEAEWEYVAHAGLPSEYAYGFGPEFDGSYAWYSGNSNNRTHEVATKQGQPSPSNPEDLIYDMSGNVWQWVEDTYMAEYQKLNATDPVNCPSPEFATAAGVNHQECFNGSSRVLRGGGWVNFSRDLRPASRNGGDPDDRSSGVGFRLLRTPR